MFSHVRVARGFSHFRPPVDGAEDSRCKVEAYTRAASRADELSPGAELGSDADGTRCVRNPATDWPPGRAAQMKGYGESP